MTEWEEHRITANVCRLLVGVFRQCNASFWQPIITALEEYEATARPAPPRARMGYIDEPDGKRSYYLALDYLRPGQLAEVHYVLPGGVFWKATEGDIIPAEARISTREGMRSALNAVLERVFPGTAGQRDWTRKPAVWAGDFGPIRDEGQGRAFAVDEGGRGL